MTDRRPKLTFGMAHFEDYDGAYFTIQSIRAHHNARDVEILVVDNRPGSPQGEGVRNLVTNWAGGKYIPFPDAVGTSAPRDRVFREASAPTVVVVDCHVLLTHGSLQRLMDWWDRQPADSRDMATGPLLDDGLGVLATHFNDQWRAEMWGTWGTAWQCGHCQHSKNHFSCIELDNNQLRYVSLLDQQPITACPRCGRELPTIGWSGHERQLIAAGFTPLVGQPDPFQIPGMGLGFFSMRRDQWVGFNQHARGFGGEELYVHAKVRAAGGRVWCHPGVQWIHRFGRPGGVRYPISRETKVRNYVLEFLELGWDLKPIEEHFVTSGLFARSEWERLLADPIAYNVGTAPQEPKKSTCGGASNSGLPQPPEGDHNLDTLAEWCAGVPRDLEKHGPKIRELSSQAQHVTAICKRREWDVFLLAGRPDDVVIWTTEVDALHSTLHQVVQATETNPRAVRRIKHYTVHAEHPHGKAIEDTDLLILDTVHHADRLWAELLEFSPHVRQRFAIRGTQAFGELCEGNNGPGLLVALRRFLRENPEWTVIYHSPEQYGLTVISRDRADKPTPPGVITMAANLAKAVAAHVADGLQKVTTADLETRMQICTLCESRRDTRCMVCGCFLEAKAGMQSSVCPLGKWPEPGAPAPLCVDTERAAA